MVSTRIPQTTTQRGEFEYKKSTLSMVPGRHLVLSWEAFSDMSAVDLGVVATKGALERSKVNLNLIDQVLTVRSFFEA